MTLETDSIKQSNAKTSAPIIIGIAGGSGSGKTYFANALAQALGTDVCEKVSQDNFYFDQSHRFDGDGGKVNFDHPDAIDFKCLADCLKDLKAGRDSEIPAYDFTTHKRHAEKVKVSAKPVILVDGILVFHSDDVRKQLDYLVFFDTPEALRFKRRLERDIKERGRTPDGVQKQFQAQVKPMHDQFVEPSKCYAHTIVADESEFATAISKCEALCRKS